MFFQKSIVVVANLDAAFHDENHVVDHAVVAVDDLILGELDWFKIGKEKGDEDVV